MDTTDSSFSDSIKKAGKYGLNEFLEIIAELSQESTKKGVLSRKEKELITLGIALSKNCERCINIHIKSAQSLGATENEIEQVNKIHLFLLSSPPEEDRLWECWRKSWVEFALTKGALEHHLRELIALGIAIIRQSKGQINLHVKSAINLSATPEQVYEVMPIALLMDGAPAISQIPRLVNALSMQNK